MPLDAQVKMMLDQLAALGAPPLAESTPEMARAGMELSATVGRRPRTPPATTDRRIPGPAGEIPVRIYHPTATGRLPMVVFLHGGGFVMGSLATHDPLCQQIAAGVPAVVVSVDYRRAPENKFPAAVDDAEAATRWAAAHADELGADPDRVAIAGDSAGGNLAAVVARRLRDAGGPRLCFQLLAYPATDMTASSPSVRENAEGYLLTYADMLWFGEQYLRGPEDTTDPDASPLLVEDLSGLPPALVLTAEFDPLRDEGEAYARRLAEAGVPVRSVRYPGLIHGFLNIDGIVDAAAAAVDETIAELRRALDPSGASSASTGDQTSEDRTSEDRTSEDRTSEDRTSEERRAGATVDGSVAPAAEPSEPGVPGGATRSPGGI